MKYKAILIFSMCAFTQTYNASKKHQLVDLCAYSGSRTFLLSYPRSGNTWLRYCLEFLTQRPSFSRVGLADEMQRPLGWSAGFLVDMSKEPIEKVHSRHDVMLKSVLSTNDMHNNKLIIIIRNPKETIARFAHATFERLLKDSAAGKGYPAKLYFENFSIYEAWPEQTRLLVYYEDLLECPRATLEIILQFMGESPVRLNELMNTIEQHIKNSKNIYNDTVHGSTDISYHSKQLSDQYRQTVDFWISRAYSHIWNMYLKDYYQE